MNKNILYLLSVLESVAKIKIYTKEFSDADELFEANYQKDFNATLNLLIAIGEDVKNLDNALKAKNSDFDWQSVVDMRNILSHNYRGTDRDIIWDIVTNYLDPLRDICLSLMVELKPDRNKLKNILETPFYKEIRDIENHIYGSEDGAG